MAVSTRAVRTALVLAAEVTPRFPDGLTVVEAGGQWRDGKGAIGSHEWIRLGGRGDDVGRNLHMSLESMPLV